MVTLADRQYTLDDFRNTICPQCLGNLPLEIQKKINFLTSKVGAPTYNKTPNFKKNRRNRLKGNSNNWEIIRNFKPTTIVRETEGVGKLIDDIILLLNKITKTNYATVVKSISNIMTNMDTDDENSLLKLGEAIFLIGSSNEFYSKLYSTLYKDLIRNFPFMKIICMKNFLSFNSLFENIEYIAAEENYDKFCDINKDNEKRRALSCFFTNLMLMDIIDRELMIDLINNLIDKQRDSFDDINEKKVIDEIAENIFILITLGKSHLCTHDKWKQIYHYIEKISNAPASLYAGLSNKTIFKFMDILETI